MDLMFWGFEDHIRLLWPCDAHRFPISNFLVGILIDLTLMPKLNYDNENNSNYVCASP